MVENYQWRPTPEQRNLFKEWETFCIGYLVSTKDGINIVRLLPELREHTGEDVPLQKMGFSSVYTFLHAMSDSLDFRRQSVITKSGNTRNEVHVHLREAAVPDNMKHVRKFVLQQRKSKTSKPKIMKGFTQYYSPRNLLMDDRNFRNRVARNPSGTQQAGPSRPFNQNQPPRFANNRNFSQPAARSSPMRSGQGLYNSKPAPKPLFSRPSANFSPAPPVQAQATRFDDDDWGSTSRPSNVSSLSAATAKCGYIPGMVESDSESSYDGFEDVSEDDVVDQWGRPANKASYAPNAYQTSTKPLLKPTVNPVPLGSHTVTKDSRKVEAVPTSGSSSSRVNNGYDVPDCRLGSQTTAQARNKMVSRGAASITASCSAAYAPGRSDLASASTGSNLVTTNGNGQPGRSIVGASIGAATASTSGRSTVPISTLQAMEAALPKYLSVNKVPARDKKLEMDFNRNDSYCLEKFPHRIYCGSESKEEFLELIRALAAIPGLSTAKVTNQFIVRIDKFVEYYKRN